MLERRALLWTLGKGVGAAAAATIGGMLLLSVAVVLLPVSDGLLLGLNQALKVISIVLGAFVAVGFGGEKGFLRGAVVGILYMVVGYACYAILDSRLAPAGLVAGEFALGAVMGSISGAIFANLRAPRKVRRARS